MIEKDMKQKSCKDFNLEQIKMIKHCFFPTFLEVPSFVPLSFDVILKFKFSPCTNVCSPTF